MKQDSRDREAGSSNGRHSPVERNAWAKIAAKKLVLAFGEAMFDTIEAEPDRRSDYA
jgi:hypothetical protein